MEKNPLTFPAQRLRNTAKTNDWCWYKEDGNQMQEWKAEKSRGLVITMKDLSFEVKNFLVSVYTVLYLKTTVWPSFGVKTCIFSW